jgi:uncharacterized repeat protein (TIGR01451 family)
MLQKRSIQLVCLTALLLQSSFALAQEVFSLTSITKTASPSTFIVGQPAEYDIVVSNGAAADDATAITVTDPLPAGVTFVSASGANWSCTGTPLVCTYSQAIAPNSSSSTLVLNVSIAPGTTEADNTATVAASNIDSNCPDTAPTPATKCMATVVVPVIQPNLTISKTASPTTFVSGQPASYIIVITNTGTGPAGPDEQFSDTLPAGVSLVGISGTNWGCSTSNPTPPVTLTCTYNQGLPAGGSTLPLTINVSVAPGTTSANNTATIGEGDPTCPQAGHCTVTVNVPVQPPVAATLPVDAIWALLLLAVALVAFSGIYLKKRQR